MSQDNLTSITVQEYVAFEKQKLNAFKKMWESHKDSSEYPQKLMLGEWLEQFLSWINVSDRLGD